jgi:excisionase family DNA binding protein
MNPFERYPKNDVPPISMRPRQAADALGVSLSTLERLTRSGQIPAAKIGRCTVYGVDALRAWVASQSEGGTHDAH